MKKLKLASIALAGLALASCINEKNSGDEKTSFTASPTIGGVDLRTLTGWSGGDSATLSGFGVTLSNNGTVAKFTCPAGTVSFTGTKTCNNSAGGCDLGGVVVEYDSDTPEDNEWQSFAVPTINIPHEDPAVFVQDNLDTGRDSYQIGFLCIPKDQVGYWS